MPPPGLNYLNGNHVTSSGSKKETRGSHEQAINKANKMLLDGAKIFHFRGGSTFSTFTQKPLKRGARAPSGLLLRSATVHSLVS